MPHFVATVASTACAAAASAASAASRRSRWLAGCLTQSVAGAIRTSLDFVLPPVCMACQSELRDDERGLCTSCTASLPGLRVCRCSRCALPLAAHACLPQALRQSPVTTLALCSYAPPLDRMVQAMKFQRRWAVGRSLADALGKGVAATLLDHMDGKGPPGTTAYDKGLGWFVTPVPLSPERWLDRGFNQAELLAEGIRGGLRQYCGSAPPSVRLLERTRHTTAQTLVEPGQRSGNLAQAFRIRRPCFGQRVILVDDVMTTGATLDSATRTLIDAGASEVIRVVLARADSPG